MEASRIQHPGPQTEPGVSLPVKFSVITPSLNQLAWLQLCIASVADQEGATVEHIVQDAGSTDGTPEWIRADARASVFVEKDSGMYDAINRGLRRAAGEIFSYLNCDEQYLPGALQKVGGYFAEHPDVEVLFADALLLNSDCRPVSYRRAVVPNARHIRFCHLNTLSCATFFRRSILDKGHFFDANWKAIGDAVWVDGLLQAHIRMACLREACSAFAFTGANLGQSQASQREADRWQPRRPFWARTAASLAHRLRKALAGAYRSRTLDVRVYTPQDRTRREYFPGMRLGFDWPID